MIFVFYKGNTVEKITGCRKFMLKQRNVLPHLHPLLNPAPQAGLHVAL